MSSQGQINLNNQLLNELLDNGGYLNEEYNDIGEPNPSYRDIKSTYIKMRACMSGERQVKAFDDRIKTDGTNFLIPFSPYMDDDKYSWYKSEAEWLGFTENYARVLVGGLLRKQPNFMLPDSIPEALRDEITNWIVNDFDKTQGSLSAFLDHALWYEMVNSRSWIYINQPVDETEQSMPYPLLINGESIINWQTSTRPETGSIQLDFLIIEGLSIDRTNTPINNRYHPKRNRTIYLHELDPASGYYISRTFQENPVFAGQDSAPVRDPSDLRFSSRWVLTETQEDFTVNGERIDFIPIFPLNGYIEPIEPMLSSLVNTELGLYNRIGRRNHLLYGSASYTPVILATALQEEDKTNIRQTGLGDYWFLNSEDDVKIVTAPSEALTALGEAIMETVTIMARLGVRILSNDENADQSGVALDIRNSYQAATLSALSKRINHQMRRIITLMINWRYDIDLNENDVVFELSSDFNNREIQIEWFRILMELNSREIVSHEVLERVLKDNEILDQLEVLSQGVRPEDRENRQANNQ